MEIGLGILDVGPVLVGCRAAVAAGVEEGLEEMTDVVEVQRDGRL